MAHLLIVEDEDTVRSLIVMTAEILGHTCIQAENGHEGLEAVAANDFDLIFTNWSMPGMDGPEFLRRLDASVRRRVPCILGSGFPEDELWSSLLSPTGGLPCVSIQAR